MRRSTWISVLSLALAACGEEDEAAPPVGDTGAAETATSDSSSPDTGAPADSDSPDTAVTPDTAASDTLVADTTTADSSAVDTSVDTSVADTTVADTTVADTTVADTAVVDTAVADTPSDAPASINCGTAPYMALDPLSAGALSLGSMTDVTVTGNICPSTKVIVPIGGMKVMNIQKATPLFIIGTQTGSLPTFTPEYNINASFPLAKLPLTMGMFGTGIPTTVADPAWNPATKAFFYFSVTSSTGAGACSTKDGVTVTVTGHPEAVIKYGGGGTSTGSGGDAQGWGTIVTTGTEAAPEYTTVVATKTGCKVTFGGSVGSFLLTGRIPFARGVASVGLGYEITNP